jgi:hypothetical protein
LPLRLQLLGGRIPFPVFVIRRRRVDLAKMQWFDGDWLCPFLELGFGGAAGRRRADREIRLVVRGRPGATKTRPAKRAARNQYEAGGGGTQ